MAAWGIVCFSVILKQIFLPGLGTGGVEGYSVFFWVGGVGHSVFWLFGSGRRALKMQD